ncbi:MAG: YceI family protein [Ignavibacteriae bacterium]|nr:YceI family protein [Ignavibacteriota bacterium]
MKTLKLVVALLFLTVSFTIAQSNWVFDASHSNVSFSVTHLVISEVEGNFKSFEGKITSENDDFSESTVEFSVDINSIDTDNADRDNHLKSDDFFNVEKFPKMKFKSKSLTKVSGKKYMLVGDLTIRDITKEVELDLKYNGTIKDPWGNTKAGFKISGAINRFDFGLKWSKLMEAGGMVVGDEVEININAELKKL